MTGQSYLLVSYTTCNKEKLCPRRLAMPRAEIEALVAERFAVARGGDGAREEVLYHA